MAESSCDVILLVGRGSRNPQWFEAMEGVIETLRAHVAPTPVEVAYLDNHPSRFSEVLPALIGRGQSVAVVPLLMAPGGHLLSDIKEFVDGLSSSAGGPDVTVLPTLTEYSEVREAFAAGVKAALSV